MPLHVDPLINDRLIDRAIEFCQTRDPKVFPFTASFNDDQLNAFVRDLRMGLSDLQDSGSKRGTASVGYPTNDFRLQEVIDDWAAANGNWPLGEDPMNPYGVAGAAPFNEVPQE